MAVARRGGMVRGRRLDRPDRDRARTASRRVGRRDRPADPADERDDARRVGAAAVARRSRAHARGTGRAASVANGDPRALPGPRRRDRRRALGTLAFRSARRTSCSEVIELSLRGNRSLAPASIVLPLAISDLPVFLRWRGEPPFGETQWEQLVDGRRPRDRRFVRVVGAPLLRARRGLRAHRRVRHRLGADGRLADRAGIPLAGDRRAGDRDPRPARRGRAAARLARLAAPAHGRAAGAGGGARGASSTARSFRYRARSRGPRATC